MDTLDDLLARHPLEWGDERLPALLDAVSRNIYRDAPIEQVVLPSGVPPDRVPWGEPARDLWFEVFKVASSFKVLPAVVRRAAASSPALAERIEELRRPEPALPPPAAVSAPAPSDYKNFSGQTLERQIVESMPTLLDVRFLGLGVVRAGAVCRIEAGFGGKVHDGTGFRIGADTVLTNHHVVFHEDHGDTPATWVQAYFGHELGLDGKPVTPTVVAGDVASLVGDRNDDWAVARVTGMSERVPILPIAGPTDPVAADDRVYIIQHPNGLPKKIGMHHNLVRYADDEVVQYWTDTDVGSSGAPVFNERWEVVALHHASVEAPAGDRHAYYNQGRAIARVATQVAAAGR